MKPLDLITVVLGLGAIALGVLVPATAAYAVPAGASMVAAGIPQVSALVAKLGGQQQPPATKP